MNTPLSKSYDTVRFTIRINGAPISDHYPVMSISVENSVNVIPKAELVLLDGDPAARDFLISDSDDFCPHKEIVISAGYDTGPETIIFAGIVETHAIRIDGGSNSTLSISCQHKAVEMTYNKTDSYTYDDDTEDTIIQDIFSDYEQQGTIKPLPLVRQMQQSTCSDWDFVISRCDMHGLHLVFKGKEYTIEDPGLTDPPVMEVEYGVSMLSFSSSINADQQVPTIIGTSWNTKDQKNIKVTAKEPTLTGQGNVTVQQYVSAVGAAPITFSASTPMTQEALQAWVDAQLLRTRLTLISGQTSFQGSAEVVPGCIISLKGVGNRFSGKVYVSSVTHNISDGNWITSVTFGLESAQPLSQKSNISATPANGQLPAAHGLQTAKVLAISNDPDGLFRVKVLPQATEDENAGLWARLSSFYSTTNNGSFFFPEVHDEVVIGFIDSDPRHPVILGSVYSDARNPAITPPDDNNYMKQLTTNGNLTVSFDDQNKVIVIKTPGGNSVTLTDKDQSIELVDQNSNSIKMSPSGIEIVSCKDIKVSAQGDITVNADQSINITATSDMNGSGMNVSVKAEAQLTLQGQASAELSATGETTVKGAMVMIN